MIMEQSRREALIKAKASRKKARERVRGFIPVGVSLSEELMAERKLEAELNRPLRSSAEKED
jgi:hypothetical protein